MRGLSFGSILVFLAACGPTVDEPSSSMGGGGTQGSPDTDDSAGETSSGESSGGSTTAPAPELDGVEIVSVSHSYECIDGCESFYFNDSLRLSLLSEQARMLEVTWYDWTVGDRELATGTEPLATEQIDLPAGEQVTARLSRSRDTFCDMDDWSEPVRVLVEIDGIMLELQGTSSGGYGWDC